MNILITGNFLNVSWDGSLTDENHIANSLEDFGHTVYKIQREDHSVLPDFDYIESPIDFVLIAQYDHYPQDWAERLKAQYRCPIVYAAFDYQEDNQDWHGRLIDGADIYLSKSIKDSKYSRWQWWCQDFAPSFLDKAPEVDRDIDVLFTGSWVPWESGQERVEYLKAIDGKFNLQINSVTPDQWKAAGFKNVQGPVMDDALPALIARTKLNFSMDHVISPGYWSDRNAQIMACGGWVLFKYVPMSETVFRQRVGYCYSVGDCLEKIAAFLKLPDEDADMFRSIAYEYAHEHLMVESRVADLLSIVESIL